MASRTYVELKRSKNHPYPARITVFAGLPAQHRVIVIGIVSLPRIAALIGSLVLDQSLDLLVVLGARLYSWAEAEGTIRHADSTAAKTPSRAANEP